MAEAADVNFGVYQEEDINGKWKHGLRMSLLKIIVRRKRHDSSWGTLLLNIGKSRIITKTDGNGIFKGI